MPSFRLPGAEHRTVIIGPTGSGKTVFAAWLLSRQRFDKRPWVCLDFKNEDMWSLVGRPHMQRLVIGDMPGRKGLYRMAVHPAQEYELERWLEKIWSRGNVGIFSDEQSLVPKGPAMKAILRQGRSLHIPAIMCTQRPVDCDREVFTESQFVSVFSIEDQRDLRAIQGYMRDAPIEEALPPYWSYWYDRASRELLTLKPVPDPAMVAASLRQVAPVPWWHRL